MKDIRISAQNVIVGDCIFMDDDWVLVERIADTKADEWRKDGVLVNGCRWYGYRELVNIRRDAS